MSDTGAPQHRNGMPTWLAILLGLLVGAGLVTGGYFLYQSGRNVGLDERAASLEATETPDPDASTTDSDSDPDQTVIIIREDESDEPDDDTKPLPDVGTWETVRTVRIDRNKLASDVVDLPEGTYRFVGAVTRGAGNEVNLRYMLPAASGGWTTHPLWTAYHAQSGTTWTTEGLTLSGRCLLSITQKSPADSTCSLSIQRLSN